MGEGFQFFDIVLFAMVAAFLVLRLRRVLGRRDGHEGGRNNPFLRHSSGEPASNSVIQMPEPGEKKTSEAQIETPPSDADLTLADGISLIKRADKRFDLQEFLTGARMAFEMILGAFAQGDTKQLKTLLSPEVFANFALAIRQRDDHGEVVDDTLIGIRSADIVEAYMEDRAAHVTVKFVSDQVSVVRDKKGDVIDGDPDHITEVTDFWTFARDPRARDLNWMLVATRSLD
jgi:predicted lipid-binding transport protein (Tim44 family)